MRKKQEQEEIGYGLKKGLAHALILILLIVGIILLYDFSTGCLDYHSVPSDCGEHEEYLQTSFTMKTGKCIPKECESLTIDGIKIQKGKIKMINETLFCCNPYLCILYNNSSR